MVQYCVTVLHVLSCGLSAQVVIATRRGCSNNIVNYSKSPVVFSVLHLQLEATANQPAVGMGAHGVVLTGWVAFALVLTLAAVVVGSAIIIYKRFFDKTRPYTVIVKAGDV